MAARPRRHSASSLRRSARTERLRLEWLESRTVLSALGLAPPVFLGPAFAVETRAPLAQPLEHPTAFVARAERELVAGPTFRLTVANEFQTVASVSFEPPLSGKPVEERAAVAHIAQLERTVVDGEAPAVRQALASDLHLMAAMVSSVTIRPALNIRLSTLAEGTPPAAEHAVLANGVAPKEFMQWLVVQGKDLFVAPGTTAPAARVTYGLPFMPSPEAERAMMPRFQAGASVPAAPAPRVTPTATANGDSLTTVPAVAPPVASATASATPDELFRSNSWNMSSAASTRSRAAASSAEGGLIELGMWSPLSNGEGGRVLLEHPGVPATESESEAMPSALDSAPAELVAAERSARSNPPSNSAEGGTIELAALSSGAPRESSATPSAVVPNDSTLASTEIRMDNPLRLFRVFELAMTPPVSGPVASGVPSEQPAQPQRAAAPLVERSSMASFALAGLVVAAVDRVCRDQAGPAQESFFRQTFHPHPRTTRLGSGLRSSSSDLGSAATRPLP